MLSFGIKRTCVPKAPKAPFLLEQEVSPVEPGLLKVSSC